MYRALTTRTYLEREQAGGSKDLGHAVQVTRGAFPMFARKIGSATRSARRTRNHVTIGGLPVALWWLLCLVLATCAQAQSLFDDDASGLDSTLIHDIVAHCAEEESQRSTQRFQREYSRLRGRLSSETIMYKGLPHTVDIIVDGGDIWGFRFTDGTGTRRTVRRYNSEHTHRLGRPVRSSTEFHEYFVIDLGVSTSPALTNAVFDLTYGGKIVTYGDVGGPGQRYVDPDGNEFVFDGHNEGKGPTGIIPVHTNLVDVLKGSGFRGPGRQTLCKNTVLYFTASYALAEALDMSNPGLLQLTALCAVGALLVWLRTRSVRESIPEEESEQQ